MNWGFPDAIFSMTTWPQLVHFQNLLFIYTLILLQWDLPSWVCGMLPKNSMVSGWFPSQRASNTDSVPCDENIMLWDTLLIGARPCVCHYGFTDTVPTETSQSHFHSSHSPRLLACCYCYQWSMVATENTHGTDIVQLMWTYIYTASQILSKWLICL